jgi:cytochrome b subunit of formate dehydrogenase
MDTAAIKKLLLILCLANILHRNNIIYFKSNIMAKYSEKAGEKVEKTMHEMKEGKLKSGSGKKVTSKKQAIAIGLSEARKEGAKVPKKKG